DGLAPRAWASANGAWTRTAAVSTAAKQARRCMLGNPPKCYRRQLRGPQPGRKRGCVSPQQCAGGAPNPCLVIPRSSERRSVGPKLSLATPSRPCAAPAAAALTAAGKRSSLPQRAQAPGFGGFQDGASQLQGPRS